MQYFVKASVFAALVACINALQVTSPGQGASWDLSKTNTITWSTVSSDPTSFSIQLVNMNVNPSVTVNIADNVQTSAGSYTLQPQTVATGGDYQINLVSKTTNNQGILAQSQQFTVSAAASSSSGSSSASSASSASSSKASSASSAASSASSSASSAMSSMSASASSAASSASASASKTTSGSASGSSSSSSSTASATKASGNAAASMHIASGAAGLGLVGAVVALFA